MVWVRFLLRVLVCVMYIVAMKVLRFGLMDLLPIFVVALLLLLLCSLPICRDMGPIMVSIVYLCFLVL